MSERAAAFLEGAVSSPADVAAWAEACAARALEGYEPEPTGDDMPPLPEPGSPERARFDAEHARIVAGLLRVSRIRPLSWVDAGGRPCPGAFCGACGAETWRRSGAVWRCAGCFPS